MVPCVVNQSRAFASEAFDVVDGLFVDPGVILNALLIMLW